MFERKSCDSSRTAMLSVFQIVLLWCPLISLGPVSQAALFHMSCHDDVTYIHSVAGNCERYVMCFSGTTFTGTCPQGYIFSDFSLRCQLPTMADKKRCSKLRLNNMPLTCLWNPRARVPSYASCAQYFDCSAKASTPGALPDYVTECPYPQLFSTLSGKCEQYYKVKCIGRTEPKAPCDYLQYRQLCQSSKCLRCEDHHPSCVGRPDGNYLIPPSTKVFSVCRSERTITIERCAPGHTFSNQSRRCEQMMVPSSPQSLPSSSAHTSGSTKATSPSLTQREIRALFEALKNPVIKQKQKSELSVPKISIVADSTKNILALKGEAIMTMSLNKTRDDQDNGDDFSGLPSFPFDVAKISGSMESLRVGLLHYGATKSTDPRRKTDVSASLTETLNNPYSKIT